jgi:Double zinc ribbon/Adenylate and Guanylate cyclase catalytic domain
VVACSACGQENPAGQRFCGQCAAPLPAFCPACGAPASSTQRFCGECASPLHPTEVAATEEPQGAARQEERRLVTALFCDLVGFTPLSERLDPEEVREIQAAYFSAMNIHVTRYGGMVQKYAGDAVPGYLRHACRP